jgi:hypothetical protein
MWEHVIQGALLADPWKLLAGHEMFLKVIYAPARESFTLNTRTSDTGMLITPVRRHEGPGTNIPSNSEKHGISVRATARPLGLR